MTTLVFVKRHNFTNSRKGLFSIFCQFLFEIHLSLLTYWYCDLMQINYNKIVMIKKERKNTFIICGKVSPKTKPNGNAIALYISKTLVYVLQRLYGKLCGFPVSDILFKYLYRFGIFYFRVLYWVPQMTAFQFHFIQFRNCAF